MVKIQLIEADKPTQGVNWIMYEQNNTVSS